MVTWRRILMLVGIATLCASPHRRLDAQGVTGPAFVLGSLRADSTNIPIVGAELVLTSVGRTTRSDSAGAFAFRVPSGLHRMIVRAVGSVRHGQPGCAVGWGGRRAWRSAPPRSWASGRQSNRRNRGLRVERLRGAAETGNRTVSRFDMLADVDPKRWASVLVERIPGIRLMMYSGHRSFASTRGQISFDNVPRGDASDRTQGAPLACYVQVIVDGVQRYGSRIGEALLDVNNMDGPFIAAEYYTASQAPPQFNRGGNAPCGTLVLWRGR